ncbi:hypothetical protein Kpol_1048p40 [Vanderwaltozyma polyspora DSM 70294]|uniref:Elongator complex protein 4 n=1 Tax=Vanderwaltozyma polyspora (strain ATCC 22028 / DSM 70294 / BCRC 21397 / CBS 2163 / NBRC 10782 / NRRL Y-8283 / UCD 57-17) TaxID=436907 RepID=A7TGK2_VANPO|nr:uncharacterized protein Kpol_1048p40 [Vanderwaltozyma polyspora DSM 70294]EDO18609.1 hypothetical protein Kpol_1048p40 [Vanderwaltozyma polyspora DSM 70294]
MSFRKRGEVLNNGSRGQAAVPGRVPLPTRGTTSAGINRGPASTGINRGLINNMRSERGTGPSAVDRMRNLSLRGSSPGISRGPTSSQADVPISSVEDSHPGIRPSPATSQQTTSTGTKDLDKLLGHMGLPLGTSLLMEETGTTEFQSVLAKIFASQGIVHNRLESTGSTPGNTHVIVLSLNQMFAKELPGIYKGSRRDVKKFKIAEEQSKVSVSNLSESKAPARSNDLKIAWRYGLNDNKPKKDDDEVLIDEHKNYNHQFDITSRIIPAPTLNEITFISPSQNVQAILVQMEQTIQKHKDKIIRIVVPSLLHPAMYPPNMFKISTILPLLHGLKSLTKKYEGSCVLFASVSSDLLDQFLLTQIESIFDSVMRLEPFDQTMLQFLERAYKSQPNKVQHGLIQILKLPIFSERGEMHVIKSEWAFKNGRKRFEIEEWGIPVEDNDEAASGDNCSTAIGDGTHDHSHSHSHSLEDSTKNTKVSLDF